MVEVLDGNEPAAPGEIGEVVITVLDATAMPFIRYRTGDLGSLDRGACPCGLPYPLLRSLEGRSDDVLLGRDHRVMHSMAVIYYIKEIPGIAQFRIYQDSVERVRLDVVLTAPDAEVPRERIVQTLRKQFGYPVEVDIQFVSALPPTASGKHRSVVSSLTRHYFESKREELRFCPVGCHMPRVLLSASLFACFLLHGASRPATYYLSPEGSNHADGRSEQTPWKTFSKAFSKMKPGDELILLDGVYSDAARTGHIGFEGDHSAQIPSGAGLGAPTSVRARNPGKVKITGGLFMGRSFRKDSYITVRGITFEGTSLLFNTSYVSLKDCGFHDASNGGGVVFGVGSNDHDRGNDHNLIEDCWIWGRNRAIAVNYRSQYNVWRRVVIRGDGCSSPDCAGSGNPNVGISVYDSAHTSLQNVVVVDRILDGGSGYADFAVAQHTPGMVFGDNEWLGTLSLKAPDVGYYFEPDEAALAPAHRMRNCIAWDATDGGINLARSGVNDVRNCTVKGLGYDAIRIAPAVPSGTLENLVVLGQGRFGINSAVTPRNIVLSGSWSESPYNQSSCTAGCRTEDPIADGSIRHIPRIEAGSLLKQGGGTGPELGAEIVYRYGIDGSRYGEPGFNTLTETPLWPWPNEARIQAEMCRQSNVTRGFCGKASLTEYIWTYLGHAAPPELAAAR